MSIIPLRPHEVTVEVDIDSDAQAVGWFSVCHAEGCGWIGQTQPLDDTGANAAWAEGQRHLSVGGGKVIPMVPRVE